MKVRKIVNIDDKVIHTVKDLEGLISFTFKIMIENGDSDSFTVESEQDCIDYFNNYCDNLTVIYNRPKTIDDLNEISLDIVNTMVKEGIINDCTDTNDETEFETQDIINEKLAEIFGLNFEKLQE